MPIDNIDIAKEDAKKADEKKADRNRELAKQKPDAAFAAQFANKIKQKEITQMDGKNKKDKEGDQKGKAEAKEQPGLMSKIIETFRSKESTKDREQQEANKKDEDKKDSVKEQTRGRGAEATAEDGHARIDSTKSSHHGGSDGESKQGSGGHEGGSGGGSGGGSQSSGGDRNKDQGFSGGHQSFSRSFGERKEGEKTTNKHAPHFSQKVAPMAMVGVSSSESSHSQASNQKLPDRVLDEIVESVRLFTKDGLTEMEITLNDATFSGMKILASQTSEGIVIKFVCPARDVKNLFLFNRPKIYLRLKEKNIPIYKVEIV